MVRIGLLQAGALLLLVTGCASLSAPTQTKPDRYVLQYLLVQRPVDIVVSPKGQTALFTAGQITEGKALFENNCKICHVGGNTLQNPAISLSILDLKQATPPRDNLEALTAFIKAPKTYDGKGLSSTCRGADFLTAEELDKLAAFVLRAAERAKGWGTIPQPGK
ncbi:photosystem II cytochrome PsbV2 [Anthocerotibacter panamensis]|uniref:photosystem II cytochrome PsbV2 n=1 Tax=Anthocerotibacter panamensis TaxID=2857077 RepID=UPI001C404B4C|nr:photosystem II cytochrome PsbV2 [Anthocerotibacter panamensis]